MKKALMGSLCAVICCLGNEPPGQNRPNASSKIVSIRNGYGTSDEELSFVDQASAGLRERRGTTGIQGLCGRDLRGQLQPGSTVGTADAFRGTRLPGEEGCLRPEGVSALLSHEKRFLGGINQKPVFPLSPLVVAPE